MTILFHELRRGRTSFLIWTASIGFMLFICMMMFPQMKGEMDAMSDLFAGMGGFTEAFGMDKVNFGEPMGFYAIECGNILGIGGTFFAAILGISALMKEEKDRTAEFLLTQPVRRISVLLQKLLAVVLQVLVMNLLLLGIAVASFSIIGEEIAQPEFWLLHLALTALQLEIACICFGLSAFLKRGGLGLGIGLAAMLYFLNIVANISEDVEFLRSVTPFAYADASTIVSEAALEPTLLLLGLFYTLLFLLAGIFHYERRDIAA